MAFQKKRCILLRQTLGDIMNWEDILKISNERARLLAHEYARADYDAGKEENAERISKPVVEEIDKFSDIIREYMADTKGEAKETFQELLSILKIRFRNRLFSNGEYRIKTATEAKKIREKLKDIKKFLVRSGIPASEFSWFK